MTKHRPTTAAEKMLLQIMRDMTKGQRAKAFQVLQCHFCTCCGTEETHPERMGIAEGCVHELEA